MDIVCFDDSKKEHLSLYLRTEAKEYLPVLEQTTEVIDGFESPFSMELLAPVDWLIIQKGGVATVEAVKKGIAN